MSGIQFEVVGKVDYNNMKRKLELEIRKRKMQMKLMGALIAKNFPTKRAHISLTVPDFAKAMEQMKAMEIGKEQFVMFSDPVESAGFHWKFEAFGTADCFGFYLQASPPTKCAGSSYELEVDYSFYLLGSRPTHGILEAAVGFVSEAANARIKLWKFQDKEQMMTFPGNFLQPDGSIQAWLDFSVQSAKFCKDDGEEENEEDANDDDGEEENEESAAIEDVEE